MAGPSRSAPSWPASERSPRSPLPSGSAAAPASGEFAAALSACRGTATSLGSAGVSDLRSRPANGVRYVRGAPIAGATAPSPANLDPRPPGAKATLLCERSAVLCSSAAPRKSPSVARGGDSSSAAEPPPDIASSASSTSKLSSRSQNLPLAPPPHNDGREHSAGADAPTPAGERRAASPTSPGGDSKSRPDVIRLHCSDGSVFSLMRAARLLLSFALSLEMRAARLLFNLSQHDFYPAFRSYVRLSSACKRTWNGFSMEGFKELRQFANLAVPSAFMICVEFWAFEIIVLLSGLLPNPQLETSVLSICLNTSILLFMVPLGLSYSVSTRVSNELGAGQPQAAKLAMRVVMCMALSSGFLLGLAMILLRSVWGHMYSNEKEVVAYIAKIMPVLAISFFIDGIHGSLSGVLTGCGKQKMGAITNLGAFYLAGIPMAVLLAFVFHMNGMGLWLGMVVCGSLTKVLLFASVAWFIDWNKEAVKAKDRVLSSSVPVK